MFGIEERRSKSPLMFYRLEYSIWTRVQEDDEWTRESGPIIGETQHERVIDARRQMVGLAQKLFRRYVYEYGPTTVDYIHNNEESNRRLRELVFKNPDTEIQELHRIRIIDDEAS